MKLRLYSLLFLLLVTFGVYAQRTVQDRLPSVYRFEDNSTQNYAYKSGLVDTILDHFIGGQPNVYLSDDCDPNTKNKPGGFISGHNCYGDIGYMQRFDVGAGTSGMINSIFLWFAAKKGNPNSVVSAKIWADNNGVPGNVIATVDIPFSAIDTNISTSLFGTPAVFPSPVNFPANGIFWGGMTINYIPGDTVGFVTTTDPTPGDPPGTTGDNLLASTSTFTQWNDNSYHSINDGTTNSWQFDVAFGFFPVVEYGTTGINEREEGPVTGLNIFPQPVKDHVNISYTVSEETDLFMEVMDITGKVVLTLNKGSKPAGDYIVRLNTDELNSGLYFVSIYDGVKKTTRKLIVHR